MLEKAAIYVVHPNEKEQGFVSALFLVPKKGGWAMPGSKFTPSKSVRPL